MTTLRLRVKPGSRTAGLERGADGSWVARVKARPVDGRANRELVKLVARHFGVARSRVSIRSGGSSRYKRIQIED